MKKKEKKFVPTSRDVAVVKALQSDIRRRKETGEPLRTDTEIYIFKDVPGRFGKD